MDLQSEVERLRRELAARDVELARKEHELIVWRARAEAAEDAAARLARDLERLRRQLVQHSERIGQRTLCRNGRTGLEPGKPGGLNPLVIGTC